MGLSCHSPVSKRLAGTTDGFENAALTVSWSQDRTFTHNRPLVLIAAFAPELRFTHTISEGGSSDTAVTAEAVMP